jgi:hypothetical protein
MGSVVVRTASAQPSGHVVDGRAVSLTCTFNSNYEEEVTLDQLHSAEDMV